MKTILVLGISIILTSCANLNGASVNNPQEKKLKVKKGDISYNTVGNGPTIVFISGGPGVCGPLYEESLRPLSDKNTFVFWNYAGCGSSKVEGRAYSIIGDSEDLNAIVNKAGAPVILMGHSYGGLLAIKYAAEHPNVVKGLILINSMTSFSHAQESMSKKIDFLVELGLKDEYLYLGEKAFSGNANEEVQKNFWLLESKLQVHDQKFSSVVAKKLQPSFEVAGAIQSDLMHVDYSKEFQNLKIPVLIAAGLFDIIALKRPQEMHSLLPESTLNEYQNSGHMPFLEENQLFINQTADWLKANSLR